jgi:chorismate mutase
VAITKYSNFCLSNFLEMNIKKVYPSKILIAGPCSAETQKQVFETAQAIKQQLPNAIFRAGIWKPRSRIGTFEGVGTKGLKWLNKVQHELNMTVCTEVANAKHVQHCLKHNITTLWIGARTTTNPFAVQEIADALYNKNCTVFIKNPINLDLELWIGAIERIYRAGIKNVAAIHRGFHSNQESEYRNAPYWEIAIKLKTIFPQLTMICDPSHISGNVHLMPIIAQKAFDLNMDGLMIETHINPKLALSDAQQQITPNQLYELYSNLNERKEVSENIVFKNKLEILRNKIDELDDELLNILTRRVELSKKIGQYKKENNVTILQVRRWNNIMNKQLKNAKINGISNTFVKYIFDAIHDESIEVQTKVFNSITKKKNGSIKNKK